MNWKILTAAAFGLASTLNAATLRYEAEDAVPADDHSMVIKKVQTPRTANT